MRGAILFLIHTHGLPRLVESPARLVSAWVSNKYTQWGGINRDQVKYVCIALFSTIGMGPPSQDGVGAANSITGFGRTVASRKTLPSHACGCISGSSLGFSTNLNDGKWLLI